MSRPKSDPYNGVDSMPCLTDFDLLLYKTRYSELTERPKSQIMFHLEHCPECRIAAEQLESKFEKVMASVHDDFRGFRPELRRRNFSI